MLFTQSGWGHLRDCQVAASHQFLVKIQLEAVDSLFHQWQPAQLELPLNAVTIKLNSELRQFFRLA